MTGAVVLVVALLISAAAIERTVAEFRKLREVLK